jgi:hypothetical protein
MVIGRRTLERAPREAATAGGGAKEKDRNGKRSDHAAELHP